jgi:hypothetical protein
MATRTLPWHRADLSRALAVRRVKRRVFRCHYRCDPCDVDWDDELLTAGPSWCPVCEAKYEPTVTDEYEEERLEWI